MEFQSKFISMYTEFTLSDIATNNGYYTDAMLLLSPESSFLYGTELRN